jgi:hypothetical protein
MWSLGCVMPVHLKGLKPLRPLTLSCPARLHRWLHGCAACATCALLSLGSNGEEADGGGGAIAVLWPPSLDGALAQFTDVALVNNSLVGTLNGNGTIAGIMGGGALYVSGGGQGSLVALTDCVLEGNSVVVADNSSNGVAHAGGGAFCLLLGASVPGSLTGVRVLVDGLSIVNNTVVATADSCTCTPRAVCACVCARACVAYSSPRGVGATVAVQGRWRPCDPGAPKWLSSAFVTPSVTLCVCGGGGWGLGLQTNQVEDCSLALVAWGTWWAPWLPSQTWLLSTTPLKVRVTVAGHGPWVAGCVWCVPILAGATCAGLVGGGGGCVAPLLASSLPTEAGTRCRHTSPPPPPRPPGDGMHRPIRWWSLVPQRRGRWGRPQRQVCGRCAEGCVDAHPRRRGARRAVLICVTRYCAVCSVLLEDFSGEGNYAGAW